MIKVERLEDSIKNAGFTSITVFEKESGIANGTVGKWRRGAYKPSLENVEKVATYLDVSIDYLVGRTDNPKGGIE